MKLRIPTLSDLLALFFTSTSVDACTASITRQVQALAFAEQHHCDQADKHMAFAADLKVTALALEKKADEAIRQAARAARVADRLSELTA